MLKLFKRKPGYIFRNFIHGQDHRCVRCKQYAHRENFDFILHICDNCGINASLHKQLGDAITINNKQNATPPPKDDDPIITAYSVYVWHATYVRGRELLIIGASSEEEARAMVNARQRINRDVIESVHAFDQIPNATAEKRGILRVC